MRNATSARISGRFSITRAIVVAIALGSALGAGCNAQQGMQAQRQEPVESSAPRDTSPAAQPSAATQAPGAAPAPAAPPSKLEQGQLRQRALDFIVRAAKSDIDVVACNAIEALVHIDADEGARLFRAAIGSESALVRFAGLVAAGEIKDRESLERAQRCLSDGDPRVRLAAAFAAYRGGDRNQAWTLVDTLRDSKDVKLRCDAAYLIGRMGDKGAVKFLRTIANDKNTPAAVSVHTVAAMATLGDARAVDELSQLAQGSAEVRVIALQSMIELANPATREALLYRFHLEKEEHLETRLIAARGLGRLGNKEGFKLALDSLGHVGKNPEDTQEEMRVRSLAALALGDIGDARALAPLRQLAETAEDSRVQVAASVAICHIVNPPMGSQRGRGRP